MGTGYETCDPGGAAQTPHQTEPNQTKMKSSNQDKVEGSAKDLKGKVKESVGRATGDRSLQARGNADQAAGKIQKKTGDVKKVFGK